MSGIPAAAFGPGDFMMIRAELVRLVGGPGEALVAALIFWKAHADSPVAYERDGSWWWNASQVDMAERTGLTVDQVRRAGKVLTDSGMVETARHQLTGISDRSYSYRVITGDTPMRDSADFEAGQSPHVQAGQSPLLPSTKTVKTTAKRAHAMPADMTWSNAHSLKAVARGLDVDVEFQKFTDYHLSKGSTFVDWERAFHTWLNNARPNVGYGGQRAATTRPSREDEIREFLGGDLGLDHAQGEIER